VRRNNIVSRSFHNTTSLYNYQYNATVKLKEGVDKINAAYRVAPEGYIPVWFAGTEEDAKANTATFDQSIEICEIALQKHNQKDNKWIDNFRYNIGRAWFYKRNYILAISNFEFVLKKYPDSKLIPLVYVWLVKTHYMDDNPTQAMKIIEEHLSHMELKKREKGELALVRAQVFLDQGNIEEVLRTLNANKDFIKGANNRARVHYLLGQIYQNQDQYAKAYENYRAVTKINTDYELIFNAKLNLAKLMIAHQDGDADNDRLMRLLRKMLKDEKNVDYKDRVYYEIAMLYYKLDKKKTAIKNLKLSIAANTNNQRQKAISYYKVGQIYFYDLKDFTHAQAYFDSASLAITQDAPEYREISTISATLKEYVGYLNTIHLQDSLLELSKMSDKALESYVDEFLEAEAKRKEAEEQKRLDEMNALNDPNLFNQFGENQTKRGSGFYFDSPDQVNAGKIKFEQVWGTRKNEDNWRRKNKTLQVAEDEETGSTVEVSEEEVKKYGSAEKARMIKNVPRTEAAKAEANGKVVEALYGLGQVYQNKLNIQDSAIVVYNRLVSRYPDSEYALKSRYALFKIYKDREDDENANEQKRKICSIAPNSKYCKFVNGESFEENKESMESFASAYKALLETFRSKDWNTTIEFSNFIINSFPEDQGLAEVYMIRGKSYGNMGRKDSLITIYNYTKTTYPDSDVIPEVNRTLALLSGEQASDTPKGNDNKGLPGDNNNPKFAGFEADRKPHEKVYVVLFVEKEKLQSNQLQQKVNEFNGKYYAEKRLNVSVFLYQNQYHMPYISQFDTEKEAVSYISALQKDMDLSVLFTEEGEKAAFISPANFRTAYGKKRMEDYFLYYEEVLRPLVK
jgi:tetratricopeptide (TPR) repeat protein